MSSFDIIKNIIHEYLDNDFDRIQIRIRNSFYVDIYLWKDNKKYAYYATKYFIYINGVIWLKKCIMREYKEGTLHEIS